MDRAKRRFASALDGFRSLHNRTEIMVDEKIQPEHCKFAKIVRHGYPDDSRCLAYDPIQKLIGIGTGHGTVRILGDAGVDYLLKHETDHAVLHMQFLVNEGGLITACSNDMIHLWNFRQKNAEIVHSLQLSKESVTCIHLPVQSKWLYIGTDKGNIYFAAVGTFQLSSYVINWNKAIDLSCRVHPGPIKQLLACPTDANRLLIVYEKGVVVIWNLNTKEVDRFPLETPIKTASWHYDGRQVMTGNADGSICIYNTKRCSEPLQKTSPHGSGPCRPIYQLDWRHTNDGEQLVIFSGGMPAEDGLPVPALTLLRANRSATVLEMDHPILSFITLPSVPWPSSPQHPHAVAVLLKNDIMYIDLLNQSYPCLESPHAMDMHESPVTAVSFYSDCSSDLIGALTLVGCKQRKRGYSDRQWPINGGVGRECATGHQELVLTGHKDGTVRFWQASGENLQFLYRLKTASHFERLEEGEQLKDVSYAVSMMQLCTESRLLLVAGHAGQATLFRFVKSESTNTIAVVNIPLLASVGTQTQAPVEDRPGPSQCREMRRQRKFDSRDTENSTDTSDDDEHEKIVPFKVRGAPIRRSAGYQPELACLVPWPSTSNADTITSTAVNSAYGVIGLGTQSGLALVDIAQCALIYAWTAAELYGSEPTPCVQLSTQLSECQSPGTGSEIVITILDYDQDELQFWMGSPPLSPRALSPRPPSRGSNTAYSCNSDPNSQRDPLLDPTTRNIPQRTKTFTAPSRTSVVGIIRRNTAELAASARSRFQHKDSKEKDEPKVQRKESKKEEKGKELPEREEDSSSPEMIDPARRSHSVKGGLMRRFTKKSTNIARSLSFHNHIEEKERESEGDSSRESPALQRSSAVVATSPTASQQSFERRETKEREQECVSSIAFIHSFSKRNETKCGPIVWVGTSAGACIALNLILPSDRFSNTVVVAPSGTVIKMRGQVIYETFMDGNFCLLSPATESYKETSKESKDSGSPEKTIVNRVRTKVSLSPTYSNSLDGESNGNGTVEISQMLITVSEWEIRIIALPAFSQVFVHKCEEIPFVKAKSSHVRGHPILICLSAAGQIIVFSLPSLRPLHSTQLIPHSVDIDDPIVQKTAFSEHGLGVYMASPSELEKYTVCSDMVDQVEESLGELFVPADMPEQPKQSGLLKGGLSAFFSANTRQDTVDLDNLFSDKDKPPSTVTSVKTVGKVLPGPSVKMERAQAGGVSAGLAAQMALQNLSERGERLNQVVDATENLRNSALNLSSRTGKLVEKYEKKKWYNF